MYPVFSLDLPTLVSCIFSFPSYSCILYFFLTLYYSFILYFFLSLFYSSILYFLLPFLLLYSEFPLVLILLLYPVLFFLLYPVFPLTLIQPLYLVFSLVIILPLYPVFPHVFMLLFFPVFTRLSLSYSCHDFCFFSWPYSLFLSYISHFSCSFSTLVSGISLVCILLLFPEYPSLANTYSITIYSRRIYPGLLVYQDQPGLTSQIPQILKATQAISQSGLTPRLWRTHSPNLNQA